MEDIISELLKPLSVYCISICKANCCKIGKIILNKNEYLEITKNLPCPQILIRPDGYYELSMNPHCPSLKGSLCSIYNTSNKPKICSEYPLFLRGKTIFAASSCPAISDQIIDLNLLKEKGFNIIIQ